MGKIYDKNMLEGCQEGDFEIKCFCLINGEVIIFKEVYEINFDFMGMYQRRVILNFKYKYYVQV